MFSGARLRRLRNERGLSQAALARTLNLSTSYVNQLENDQRPITVPVLVALAERFDLPSNYFSTDSDARLVADLSDVFTAAAPDDSVSSMHIEELVARMPEVGRNLVTVYRRLRDATEELEAYRSHATTETSLPAERPMPFEEVRDFFYDRNNYIGELDIAAEQMFTQSKMTVGGLDVQLSALMHERFGVRVVIDADLPAHAKRSYDPETMVLRIAQWLLPGQRAFQIATQLALVSQPELLSAIVATDDQLTPESRGVARIGLANYFAGAFCCPIVNSTAQQQNYVMTSTCWPAASRSASKRCVTGSRRCSGRSYAGCRSSSSEPTRPATSRNVSPPPHFTSAGSAAAVHCGWYTTPSLSRGGSSRRSPRCLMAVRISGWPRPPRPKVRAISVSTRASPSAWAAT